MRALISVSDKQGIIDFSRGLSAQGVDLISTGNTQRIIAEADIPVQSVSEVTGFPEILDGRVKTLHPSIHGGILARRDIPAHQQQLSEYGIEAIDLVVVNLYPFAQTIAKPDVTLGEALEHIDIGGVALLRAAAKNFSSVIVVVDPNDYDSVLEALRVGEVSDTLRQHLASKVFAHTAGYDSAIASYLSTETFPQTLPMTWNLSQSLRYGENPHQKAALYGEFNRFFQQLHGKDLSYTNILDITGAQELIEEFPISEGIVVAILKHTNPCGVGMGETTVEAWKRALATDSVSAFGGIVVLNTTCDLELAKEIDTIFTEIIIAPDFAPEALELLRKKKNRRLMLSLRRVSEQGTQVVRSIPGGVLVQDADYTDLEQESFKVVTKRQPTDEEAKALRFAWRVAKHVKSNAIVYTDAMHTLGIGAGQMSRVDSSHLAVWKAQNAGLSLHNSVVASDALFPFADGVQAALEAGATAIIQPGGSVRDEEVIAAADEVGAAMVFTGYRHFWH
jgi:phosphoribosylaminoimidazolecarboxamide formyltransferase/IMP cyclohydrolase